MNKILFFLTTLTLCSDVLSVPRRPIRRNVHLQAPQAPVASPALWGSGSAQQPPYANNQQQTLWTNPNPQQQNRPSYTPQYANSYAMQNANPYAMQGQQATNPAIQQFVQSTLQNPQTFGNASDGAIESLESYIDNTIAPTMNGMAGSSMYAPQGQQKPFIYVAMLYTVGQDGVSASESNAQTEVGWKESLMQDGFLQKVQSPQSPLYQFLLNNNIPFCILDAQGEYLAADVSQGTNYNDIRPWIVALNVIKSQGQFQQAQVDATVSTNHGRNLAQDYWHSAENNTSSLYTIVEVKGKIDDGLNSPFHAWNSAGHPCLIIMQYMFENGSYVLNPAVYAYLIKPSYLLNQNDNTNLVPQNYWGSLANFIVSDPNLQAAVKSNTKWVFTPQYDPSTATSPD